MHLTDSPQREIISYKNDSVFIVRGKSRSRIIKKIIDSFISSWENV